MRNLIILSVLVFSMAVVSQSHAQSGSRGGFGGGGGGGFSGGGFTGGGFTGGGSGFANTYGSQRLSRAERQQLEQQEALVRQQQAQQAAQLRAAQAKLQFKQTLAQLANSNNRAANSRQHRNALDQAKRDFRSLRTRQVSPNQLGPLQQPFRLTIKEINRQDYTANWPEVLQKEEFGALVQSVDKAIMDRAVNDTESATQFLNDLGQLNTALNAAAVSGQVDIKGYAQARRFITGLANEIRATDLVM